MRDWLRDPGWLATLGIGAAALAVAVVLAASRLTTPTEQAVIPTEAWPWSGVGVGVSPIGLASEFREGDVVVGMAGRPVAAWLEDAIRPPWDAPPPAVSSPVAFDVIRAGRPVALDVALSPFPMERLRTAPVGLFVFGAGVLVLALVLVARRARSTALRLLFVGAAANAADIVAWEVGLQPTDLTGSRTFVWAFAAAALFNLVFWSTILHILAIYPVRSPLVARRTWLVPAMYLVPLGVFAGLVATAWLAGGTVIDRVDRLASCVGAVASGMLVAIVVGTVAGFRRTGMSDRRRVRLVALTLVVAAIATLVLVTLPIAFMGSPLVSRSTVSLVALPVPIALAIAVFRDRLFQVSRLSRSRGAIVAAREEERRRLRRELHDDLAPTLAAIGLKLDMARSAVREDPAAAEAAIAAIRADVRAAVSDIRRLARELRPPALDALGLVGAVREQATTLSSEPGAPVMLVEADTLPALPAAVEVAAYRIAVEAMLNAIRHAGATRCDVTLAITGDVLDIEIVDDGGGITGSPHGVGTRSMRERAAEVGGDVMIGAAEDRGTRVVARLPVMVLGASRELRR